MEAAPSPTRQILLVDDDVAFTAMMKDFLLSPGHGLWIVHTAENYTAALEAFRTPGKRLKPFRTAGAQADAVSRGTT